MRSILVFSLLLMLSVTTATLSSCSKEEGFGGQATISGTVSTSDGAASGAIVYIAYGTKERTTAYDHSTVADANGYYELGGLQKGDYFVDAQITVIKDNFQVVLHSPGYGVTIGQGKGEVKLDIDLY